MAVSYEELMEKKLDRIDDRRDKRQGSLIYDALAPNAAETAQFYADLDLLADRTFADTAVGEDLTRRAAERGMLRKGAVKATFYGRFLDADGAVYPVENGTRFALEEYIYISYWGERQTEDIFWNVKQRGRAAMCIWGSCCPWKRCLI